jgi:AcrR family transcriptional regulator
MGNKERQEREREATRKAILDAARVLFVEEGYANVSVRKVADRIEYSAAAIYSYFESKDDIFFALAEEGFRLLEEALRMPEELAGGDPVELLRRGFRAYYGFSREHAEHFALMFVDRAIHRIACDPDRFGFVHTMVLRVTDIIRAGADRGLFPAETDAHAAFHVLWASVHGAAVMNLSGLLMPGEDPEALAQDTFEAALAGLRAGSPTTFRPALPPTHPCEPRPTVGASDEQA